MVYLLHFTEPETGQTRRFRHAGHYMGWAPDRHWRARLSEHAKGKGANLLRHVLAAGITWELVRRWPGGSRADERRLKRQGGLSRHCPVCRASGSYHR